MLNPTIPGVIARPKVNLWNPGLETGLLGWFDQTTDRYASNVWTARYGSKTTALNSGSAGPTKTSAGFSGDKAGLIFTGTSNTGINIASPGDSGLWIVQVLKFTTLSDNAITCGRGAGGSQRTIAFIGTGFRCNHRSNDLDEYDTNAAATDGAIFVTRHTDAARNIRSNGEQKATNALGTSGTSPLSTDALQLGNYEGSSKNWTMCVAAWGIFTGASYTQALAEKVEGFCAHNSIGIVLATLPVGHPYKTLPPTA